MPYSDEVDSSSGGLLLAYTGKVSDAYFEDGKFGVQLNIQVLLDHPENHPHIPDGVIKNWFGVGNGWRVEGNGARVTPFAADGKKPPSKFNGNTLAGRLVGQVASLDTDEKLLANGTTKEAAFWKGIGSARWGGVNIPRQQQVDGAWKGVQGGKDVSMPVELLDQAGVSQFEVSSLGWDAALTAIVQSCATGAKDYTGFIQAVVTTAGTEAARQAVTSPQTGPQIYESLKAF